MSDHEYLVIERDSLVGEKAKFKRIYAIESRMPPTLENAHNWIRMNFQKGFARVTKRLCIDLLDPQYPYHGTKAMTKPEGIAWGPRLADGSRCLMVALTMTLKRRRRVTFWLLRFLKPLAYLTRHNHVSSRDEFVMECPLGTLRLTLAAKLLLPA